MKTDSLCENPPPQSAASWPDMPLFGCPPGALQTLRTLMIAIIGCGSVGGRIAILLARLGIGGLLLVDPKRYKPASVATHDIAATEVGQPKAAATARRVNSIHPMTRVIAREAPIESLDLTELVGVDLVVMAPDLLAVEIAVAQRCLWLGIPLLHASVHGATLTSQIRFFSNARDRGSCPACAYTQAEWDLLWSQVHFSCEGPAGADSGAGPAATAAPATNSIGATCSISADLAIIQLIRFVLGLGQPVTDTMLEYNGVTHRTHVSPISRRPDCRLDHTTFTRVKVDQPLPTLSPAQLVERSFGVASTPGPTLEIIGHDWVEFAACRCERPTPIRRFVARAGGRLKSCPRCATRLQPLDFHRHHAVGPGFIASDMNRSLGRLGVRRASGVILRAGDSGVLLTPSTP